MMLATESVEETPEFTSRARYCLFVIRARSGVDCPRIVNNSRVQGRLSIVFSTWAYEREAEVDTMTANDALKAFFHTRPECREPDATPGIITPPNPSTLRWPQ
jgi:hypothetical protein